MEFFSGLRSVQCSQEHRVRYIGDSPFTSDYSTDRASSPPLRWIRTKNEMPSFQVKPLRLLQQQSAHGQLIPPEVDTMKPLEHSSVFFSFKRTSSIWIFFWAWILLPLDVASVPASKLGSSCYDSERCLILMWLDVRSGYYCWWGSAAIAPWNQHSWKGIRFSFQKI